MARNRAFAVALAVSALLHLSMFTMFSIGVYFEREPIDYIPLNVVAVPAASGFPAPASSAAPSGESPRLEDPLASVPPIDLPEFQFAEFERLRLTEASLDIGARFEHLVSPGPRDSWARFGQEIRRLQNVLTRLPMFEDDQEAPRPGPQLVSRPAPGHEIYLEWLAEPRDRALLFSPPIEALHSAEAAGLPPTLTFVVRVNAMGRIVEVIQPLEDEAGVVSRIARALIAYRFDPLPSGQSDDQHGTLLVQRVE